jgi:dTMP kinase
MEGIFQNMGKLIVIEGLDGSGKTTQLGLLPKRLAEHNIEAKEISFPDYEDPSSMLVRMYLSGEFGKKPDDVNAFAASLFYAVDRYASYKRHWGEYYENGGIIISGRYVESNAYHQMAKLPEEKWAEYLDWLYETEYSKTAIPKPDLVIFLDMPVEVSTAMMTSRYKGDENKKDIHEKDAAYLTACRKAAKYAAEKCGWTVINCADGQNPRSVESISDEITKRVLDVLK